MTDASRPSAPTSRATLLLAAPAAFLLVFFAWPLARTLRAATTSSDAWHWLATPYVQDRILIALLQALLSVALALAIALPLAWLHHTRRIPGGRWAVALHAAPFVLPVFVVVYGLQQLLGPAGWFTWSGRGLLATFGPLGAVVIAHAYYNHGLALHLTLGALDRRPHRLEEAAQVLGASPRAAFLRVTLPILLPSFAGTATLVFLMSFGAFGTVLLLGASQVSTLETMLYQNLGGIFPRTDRAAVLGVVQLAINLGLLGIYALLHRRFRVQRHASRQTTRSTTATLVAWICAALALLPILAVLAGGFRLGEQWSLEPWRALLDHAHPSHLAGFDLGRALARTLTYAAATCTLSLALVLCLAYGARRLPRGRRLAEGLAGIPLGTSSLLLGFGFLLTFGAGSLLDLRGHAWLIVVTQTLVAFPFTARILLPALHQHDVRIDEAASLLGATPRQVVTRIHAAVLRGPLLAAAGFAAALSLGDYGAGLLLLGADEAGLSVWILKHDRPFDPLMHAQATALAGVLALLACLALAGIVRHRSEVRP